MEPESVSKLYFRQTKRIEIELGGPQYVQKMMDRLKAMIEQSESDVDEDGDLVENLYSVQNFGTGPNDDKHALNLLKRFQQSQKEEAEITKDLPEDQKFAKDTDASNLESINEENNLKNDISKTYKLFNYVCQQNKDQILRYLNPTIYRG